MVKVFETVDDQLLFQDWHSRDASASLAFSVEEGFT